MPIFESPFGYTYPEKDKREMCRYCFNEDTARIVDPIDLEPFKAFHGDTPFKAFSCHCCGAKWHFTFSPE